MSETILWEQLCGLAGAIDTPMHMPGHKRRLSPVPGFPVQGDLTEVWGADDLHDAHGILLDAMERTAALWGSRRTYYLVNGSTCGVLAGLRALAPAGSRVIAARNCHRSVYNALELGENRVHWLLPPTDSAFGICGSIPPAQVEQALDACPDAAAVVITSPTYEGVLSDIAGIAAICHARGVPLMVDEAHGAHLDLFSEGGFTGGALRGGADLVVQSPHKTLPSLTQTALLHLQGTLADPAHVERQLQIFESSSPSYLLLSSLDGCTGILRERGKELFGRWGAALDCFEEEILPLRNLRVLCRGRDSVGEHPVFFGYDRSKILIDTAGTGCNGESFALRLREHWGIETEMYCGSLVLAMTGCGDGADPTGIEKLALALREIDREKEIRENSGTAFPPLCWGETVLPAGEALRAESESVPWESAEGRICAEYVSCYPPGIPLLSPGERVERGTLEYLRRAGESGTRVMHSLSREKGNIVCVQQQTV